MDVPLFCPVDLKSFLKAPNLASNNNELAASWVLVNYFLSNVPFKFHVVLLTHFTFPAYFTPFSISFDLFTPSLVCKYFDLSLRASLLSSVSMSFVNTYLNTFSVCLHLCNPLSASSSPILAFILYLLALHYPQCLINTACAPIANISTPRYFISKPSFP